MDKGEMFDNQDPNMTGNIPSGAKSAEFGRILHDMISFPAERLKVGKEMF
jgi:hypothetical protein